MKIKLIIASGDQDYGEHLSRILSDKYADVFEVSICSTLERLNELLKNNRYEVALLEADFLGATDLASVRLSLFLYSDAIHIIQEHEFLRKIKKYQRISAMVGAILENYSEFSSGMVSFDANRASVTAVWSPAGGTGKTTVALAYATRKVADGKHATYLCLENFSSVSTYFPESGKSISTVFEKLEADVPMLLMGIRQQDSGSGITYFCTPKNYDDINVLTTDDLNVLVSACGRNTDEVIIDLSSQCDEKTWAIFELADTVLIVHDSSVTSQAKLKQFMIQHNIAQKVEGKIVLIGNKGAKRPQVGIQRFIHLPLVQSGDAVSVYKSLSGNAFEW